jgi:hypothetical protein
VVIGTLLFAAPSEVIQRTITGTQYESCVGAFGSGEYDIALYPVNK